MKKICKITVLLLFFTLSVKTYAQLDTLKYLKDNFEGKKTEFIGKPFSYLLSQMTQIQPKTVWGGVEPQNIYIYPYSTFNFVEKSKSFMHNTIVMAIIWKEPILVKEAEIYEKKNKFYFTAEEKAFYGDKIVGDIKIY